MRDQGTGHTTVHHHETEIYDGSYPRQYHFHTQTFHTSRKRYSGDPSAFFCPIGSAKPETITAGHYTFGGDDGHNRTRVGQRKAKRGFFAEEGKLYRCPPGRYGHEAGLSTEFCSGFCPAGFYCPWNTSEPLPCAKNHYSVSGSAFCTKCPLPPHEIDRERCRTSRNCCFV